MNKFYKVMALALAVVLCLGMTVVAFADEPNHKITITGSVEGTEYKLYKLLDATVDDDDDPSLYSYTVNSAWSAFFSEANKSAWESVFRITAAGNVEALAGIENDAAVVKAFARAAAAYAKENSIAPAGTETASGTSVEFKTADGYYLVTSSLGSNAMLDTTPGDQTIVEKNEVPTIVKKIKEDNEQLVDANDVNVGDTIEYQVTVEVKAGTDTYVVTDTFSAGLDYDESSLKIKATTGDDPVKDTDYTVTYNDRVLTISFKDDYINKLTNKNGDGEAKNDTLTFTYSATVNSNAVIKDTANPNTVKLEYNHNGTTGSQEDTVKTYTYGFDIKKINGANEALAGAKFTLTSGKDTLYFTKTTDNDHNIYTYAGTEEGTGLVTALETSTNGYIYIKGLDAGTYTLTETAAPKGYNLLSDSIDITINATIADDGSISSYEVKSSDSSGVVSAGTHAGHYYNDNTSGDLVKEIDILNNIGTVLPSTGGIGTTILYVIGSILVLGAGVVLISKRRAG